jgi:hypothetical protein
LIAMMIFLVFLVGGILGIGRFRNELLGTGMSGEDLDPNPAWLQQAIAEHRASAAKAAAGSTDD